MNGRFVDILCSWLALALCLGLAGCEPAPVASPLRYEPLVPGPAPLRVAIHPLHNPQRLLAVYGPLVEVLQARLGEPVDIEASRGYASYEDKIRRRGPAVLLSNPWQTLLAQRHGYRVVAMAGDPDDFHGLLVARRDGPVHVPADLRGREIAYPAPTAVAAAMLPQWFLSRAGLAIDRDVKSRYVGSQESALLNVWSGDTAAAGTWPQPWRAFQQTHPEKAAALHVLWRTGTLPGNAVMVRDDLPPAQAERLRGALLALHQDAEGRRVLAAARTARFSPADDSTYGPVHAFVDAFEREVRPIEARP